MPALPINDRDLEFLSFRTMENFTDGCHQFYIKGITLGCFDC